MNYFACSWLDATYSDSCPPSCGINWPHEEILANHAEFAENHFELKRSSVTKEIIIRERFPERASLALRSTRTGQSIDQLLGEIHKSPSSTQEWGGMKVFLNQQISRDDERMKAVYNHFRRNLSDIVQVGSKSGAGIVAGTVAVNLKDCAPFASAHRRGLSDANQTKWEDCHKKGVSAHQPGNPAEAAGWFLKAAEIDDEVAELRFRQGAFALALGQTGEAPKQFSAVCDLDTLRFRCDSRLNELIRQAVSNENDHRIVKAWDNPRKPKIVTAKPS